MTEPESSPDDTDRVRRLLAGAPSSRMPPEVAARLDGVLAEESRRRSEQRRVKGDFGVRPARPLLVTDPVPAAPRWRRPAAVALVAAVTAASVGVAGYTLSAAAGLNEPVAGSAVTVRSADLAADARAVLAARDLSAHTFSGAWRCARTVTDGRITGLTRAVVDGNPALLVYTRTQGADWVTVVTGCPGPAAVAQNSVRLQ